MKLQNAINDRAFSFGLNYTTDNMIVKKYSWTFLILTEIRRQNKNKIVYSFGSR